MHGENKCDIFKTLSRWKMLWRFMHTWKNNIAVGVRPEVA
jgi:hypothetical protein